MLLVYFCLRASQANKRVCLCVYVCMYVCVSQNSQLLKKLTKRSKYTCTCTKQERVKKRETRKRDLENFHYFLSILKFSLSILIFFNFEKNLLFYCYIDPRPSHVTLDGNDNECAM